MANQQLIDYINQQLKVGVSKEVIRAALLSAGWAQGDIEDAMKSFDLAPAGAVPSMVTSDIFQPKDIPVFEPTKNKAVIPSLERPRGAEEIKKAEAIKPKSESVIQIKDTVVLKKNEPSAELQPKPIIKAPTASFFSGIKNLPWRAVLNIVLVAGIIALAAIAGSLYKNNLGLQKQLKEINTSNNKLETSMVSLNQNLRGIDAELTALKIEKEELEAQLSIFAVLSTSTEPLPVKIKGLLSGGDKSLYSLTTDRGIVVYVKNSKEANVNAVLKPLVGTNIEISGTHLPGSREITVTKINNEEPAQASTSTAP
jgi:hypothetical protein